MTFLQINSNYGNSAMNAGVGIGAILISLVIFLFFGYCMYKLFQKAGVENAWMGFIPILNYIPMLQIAKKPTWWIILMLIPFVNLIIGIIIWIRIAKAFGKSELYGIAMLFIGFILLPLLAFGDAKHHPNALADETGKSF